ncbi:MAG: hypothetical protein ABR955_01820 [Verrucomicrobiota bacterium]|jgi:hypothetical protein
MTKKHWLILVAVVASCGLIGGALVLALTLGFFGGHEETTGAGFSLPVYTQGQQLASSHPGYFHDTLTGGGEVYVNDYEEACLQLTLAEPQTVIGLMGSISPAKVGAIPGQPVTAYIAVDCGSEMPAYVPYRNIKQPPFDWRTATFRQMTASRQYKFGPLVTTTNAALIAEVVRLLREGTPVELNPFPFSGATNLTTINLTSDQLPGILFCPALCYYGDGNIYLAESLIPDFTVTPPQVRARWIPASPMLTQWLKGP